MNLVDPQILAEASNLSPGLVLTGLFLGMVFWLFGWWTHRFWVVLLMTVLAGVHGLLEAPSFRAQPLLASVLLAVAAGLMALALVRLLAFLTGGYGGLLAVAAIHWNQPLLGFLICGLFGLLLFRLWMMALTSFTGSLLITYAGLCLLHQSETMDAVAWSEKAAVLLNWVCGFLTLVGLVVQFLLDRRFQNKKSGKSSGSGDHKDSVLPFPFWMLAKKTKKAG